MKMMLFCPDRHGARNALQILVRSGMEVIGCVCDQPQPSKMGELCRNYGISMLTTEDLYVKLESGSLPSFDLGISYLYQKRLKESIISYPPMGIINFHPAPVSVHKGVAACCYALLKGYEEWAVTAHYVTKNFDDGDIIYESWFPIRGAVTSIEVEKIAQEQSILLLEKIVEKLSSGEKLPRTKQEPNKGQYFSRKDLETAKDVSGKITSEELDRRIHALWFPPYHGAKITIDGKEYSLVDDAILKELGEMYGA